MLTVNLTHHPHARKELLLDRSLRVVSRSGLNPTERTLIEELGTLPEGTAFASPLFLGGRTGALAMAVWLKGLATGTLTLLTWDAHTRGILRRNLEDNRAPTEGPLAFAVETETDPSRFTAADAVFWQMTKGDETAETQLALLEALCTEGVPVGRAFRICADELNPTFLERFRKVCTKVSLRQVGDKKTGILRLLSGRLASPIPAERRPNHAADFEVSLRGHDPITLTTLPGCFCHRRADMGGLALTETVAEQIALSEGDRIMDMGCGCGMDGILLATAFPEKRLRLTYQDSDARAIASLRRNLARYPHNAEVTFSAEGEGEAGTYDLFLANPPYFGDWRIAEAFIAAAARLLKCGGLIAFVCKRPVRPTELLGAAGFEILNSFPRRGYTVILAGKEKA